MWTRGHTIIGRIIDGILAAVGFFLIPSVFLALLLGMPLAAAGFALMVCALMPVFSLYVSRRGMEIVLRCCSFMIGFFLVGLGSKPLPAALDPSAFLVIAACWVATAFLWAFIYHRRKGVLA